MSEPAEPAEPGPSWALIDAELARLAGSALFRRSPRHLRFLRHLVQCSLKGEAARLREVALGVEVFLRSAARFDPRQDSIVRVEARRLRQKLARWYADEGADSRLEFVLRPGRYEVELRRREPWAQPRGSVAVFELPPSPALPAALQATLGAELAAVLARLNGLRVVRGGALPADDEAALRHASGPLQVDHAVLGRVSAVGSDAVLQLRVLRCDDAGELWSRRALLPAEGGTPVLEVLETLARGIVSALHRDAAQRQLQRVRVAGSQPLLRALAQGGPSAEGLELLGLARIALRRNDVEGCRKAVQLCDKAVALMPGHAAAFALLAEALIATVAMTALPPLPTLQAARRAAERAIELDPEGADAHGQLGYLQVVHERNWPAAEAALLRALQRAPALASAHVRYGWSLMMHRRFAEARACYREARSLDPLSLLYRAHEALIALYERDWARSDAGLAAVLDVMPDHLLAQALRAALLLYRGRTADALAAYQALHQRFPGLSIGRCGLAQVHALRGDSGAARQELQRLLDAHDAGYVSPYQIAMVQARLGDDDQALHWLAEAARRSDFNFVCVAVDPAFDAVRALPSGQQLLRDTGFAHLVSA
ncbi:MAG: tetratricopeptide repeat protein [Aquabacterium sp.]